MALKQLIVHAGQEIRSKLEETIQTSKNRWKTLMSRSVILLVFGAFAIFVQHVKHNTGDVPKMEDHTHQWLRGVNRFVIDSVFLRNFFTALSSFIVDCCVLFFLIYGMISRTSRTVLSFVLVMGMRQLAQLTVDLPVPRHLWFDYPDFPSLFVDYDVKNDFFFSGHTCLAVMVTLELKKMFKHSKLWVFLLFVSIFQMLSVLIFYTHYIQDVVAGFFAPFFVQFVTKRMAKKLDTLDHKRERAKPKASNHDPQVELDRLVQQSDSAP